MVTWSMCTWSILQNVLLEYLRNRKWGFSICLLSQLLLPFLLMQCFSHLPWVCSSPENFRLLREIDPNNQDLTVAASTWLRTVQYTPIWRFFIAWERTFALHQGNTWNDEIVLSPELRNRLTSKKVVSTWWNWSNAGYHSLDMDGFLIHTTHWLVPFKIQVLLKAPLCWVKNSISRCGTYSFSTLEVNGERLFSSVLTSWVLGLQVCSSAPNLHSSGQALHHLSYNPGPLCCIVTCYSTVYVRVGSKDKSLLAYSLLKTFTKPCFSL